MFNRRLPLLVSVALPALLAAGVAVALPTAASAADTAVYTPAAQDAPDARLYVVDTSGRVVGELIRPGDAGSRVLSRAGSVQPAVAAPDRTFHPDYSNALSTGQMSAAWRAEVRRLFPSSSVLTGDWGRI